MGAPIFVHSDIGDFLDFFCSRSLLSIILMEQILIIAFSLLLIVIYIQVYIWFCKDYDVASFKIGV